MIMPKGNYIILQDYNSNDDSVTDYEESIPFGV